MPPAYHVHPEFGYFCPTPRRRRELRVAIVSILFGAIIGASIATLRVGHDRNPDGASTAAYLNVSNSERVVVAAAEATPAATNDADTKAEARESIKPFPIRRVRVRPVVHNPPIPATDATAPTPAAQRSARPCGHCAPRSRSGPPAAWGDVPGRAAFVFPTSPPQRARGRGREHYSSAL